MDGDIVHSEALEKLAMRKDVAALGRLADCYALGPEDFYRAAMAFRDASDRNFLQCACGSRRLPCCNTVRCFYIRHAGMVLMFFGTEKSVTERVSSCPDQKL